MRPDQLEPHALGWLAWQAALHEAPHRVHQQGAKTAADEAALFEMWWLGGGRDWHELVPPESLAKAAWGAARAAQHDTYTPACYATTFEKWWTRWQQSSST